MRASDLTRAQAHVIQQRLRPMVAYLLKLEERCEQRSFPRDDQFFLKVKRAHDALHDLFLECHEVGTSGTGRKPGNGK